MSKIFILVLVLTFLSNTVFGQLNENQTAEILYDSTYQVSINSKQQPLIGKFRITQLYNGEMYSSLYELRFINSVDNSLFSQVIDTVFDFTYWPDFDLVDVNFDGYKDIWTIINRDVKAQPSYHFWIFNSQQHSFELNRMFTDSLVCNLVINSEDSTISSGCSGGCMGFCGSERTFKVINNSLYLIEASCTEQVVVDGEVKLRSTTRKLINGKWQLVDENYYDYP